MANNTEQDRFLEHLHNLPIVFQHLYTQNNRALIRELEKGKFDLSKQFHRHVPLHFAILRKHVPSIQALLDFGANPLQSPINHLSPVCMALYFEVQEPNLLHSTMWDKMVRTIWQPQITDIPIPNLEGPPGPKSYIKPDPSAQKLSHFMLNIINIPCIELLKLCYFKHLIEDIHKNECILLSVRVKSGINPPSCDLNHVFNKQRFYTHDLPSQHHIPYCDLGVKDRPLIGTLDSLADIWTMDAIQHLPIVLRELNKYVVCDFVLTFPHLFLDDTFTKQLKTHNESVDTTFKDFCQNDDEFIGLSGILCHLWKEACFGHLFMRVCTLIDLPINNDVFIAEELPNMSKCFVTLFTLFSQNIMAMHLIIKHFLFTYESFETALRENVPEKVDSKRLIKFQPSVFGPIRAYGVVFIYKFNDLLKNSRYEDKYSHMQSVNEAMFKMRRFANRFSILTELINHQPNVLAHVNKSDLFFFLSSELNQKLFCYKGKRGRIFEEPETPLFIAARNKDVQTCEELLLAGAYPFTVNYLGKCFFEIMDLNVAEVKEFVEKCPAIQKPYPLKTQSAKLYLENFSLEGLKYLKPQKPLYEFVLLHVKQFKDENEYLEFLT